MKSSLRQPKIAFLTDVSGIGGGESSLVYLLEIMSQHDPKPLVICPQGTLSDSCARIGLPVEHLSYPELRRDFGAWPIPALAHLMKLVRILSRNEIELVHAESVMGLYYGAVAARILGLPCYATCHGYWPLRSSLFNFLWLKLCRSVFPVSNAIATDLGAVKGAHAGRIRAIPLGVGRRFVSDLPRVETIREQLGLSPGVKYVLQAARFQDIKGQLDLLSAFRHLVAEPGRTNVQLLFVGGILDASVGNCQAYLGEVHRQVKEFRLEDRVHFLGHREDCGAIIRAVDILVNPSHWETFGMVVIEAMAVGTPVVATSVGGHCETVIHGVTGLLVPPRDPRALASAIGAVLDGGDGVRSMVEGAAARVRKIFTARNRYEQLLDAYRCSLSTR